jgi:hypothetical protein
MNKIITGLSVPLPVIPFYYFPNNFATGMPQKQTGPNFITYAEEVKFSP